MSTKILNDQSNANDRTPFEPTKKQLALVEVLDKKKLFACPQPTDCKIFADRFLVFFKFHKNGAKIVPKSSKMLTNPFASPINPYTPPWTVTLPLVGELVPF